jgi:CARDB
LEFYTMTLLRSFALFDPVLKRYVAEPYFVDAANVGLRAQIPTAFTITGVYAPNGFACSVSGGTVSCVGGSVAGGTEAIICAAVTVPLQEGTFQYSATVDPNNLVAERNESNNTGTFSVYVGWLG